MNALPDALDALPPISLAELEDAAELLNRVDRKYFVPRRVLAAAITRLSGRPRALEIAGRRTFRYATTYFDTPSFTLYRQHAQRRRHRFKVRTRTYSDSGACRLEVKSKGLRGLTVKERIPHDPNRSGALGAAGRTFVAGRLGEDAALLHPVLDTFYRRSTIVVGDQRLTLDVDLAFERNGCRIAGPDDVLVETKTSGGASELDRMLLHAGIRPHSVSKYCLAASLLYPQLRGNDWSRVRRRYWGEPSS